MLSYRHAFHAGNHADVLKHIVLIHLLNYFVKKQKQFWCIDTHAGAAIYALDGTYARKNCEFESGISRLWERQDVPVPVSDYLNQVRAVNSTNALLAYPGSPQIARQMLRKQDRLRMFELHSTECNLLLRHFQGDAPQVIAQSGDGFTGLQTLLPPPSRRGIVLIDPSYEDKADYQRVIIALREGLRRFATGVYAVWHPMVQRRESHQFADRLKQVARSDWLHVTLTVKEAPENGHGLSGSGMFILNPPWTLPAMLAGIMPFLVQTLSQDGHAGYELKFNLA